MKQFKILDPASLPTSGVIRAEDLDAMIVASDIIAATEDWAAQQREDLVRHIEVERISAYADAYAEGLIELLDAAELHRTATSLMGDKLNFLVRKSVHHVLEQWPPEEMLKASISPVLADVEKEGEITISVHPSRTSDLRKALATFIDDDLAVSLSEDPLLSVTGCVIYTPSDVINVSVDVLVDQLIEGLSGYLKLAETAQQEEIDERL
jgi:flagellar biosynthesis/type III secretory pathway protein FliH